MEQKQELIQQETIYHTAILQLKLFLKIDSFNAFNTISRTAVLYRASELIPAFLPYLTQCYFGPTILSSSSIFYTYKTKSG
jgi:hypothetical protein